MDAFSELMRERLKELADLVSTEENTPALSLETLLDTFIAVYTDCKLATNQNEQISGFLQKYYPIINKLESLRIGVKDFETIKTLATGAVGRVCLVRCKKNKQVYAMKILKKQDLLTRQEAAFFMEERNALVFSQKSNWITTLYASFQDEENLYLVMEYVGGGSFRAYLNNRETIMTEDEARFYLAEMVLSLDELHRQHYIHRDVKPENYLLDSKGHIKLADFGSCIRISEAATVNSHVTVGTPDYISPEILRANERNAEYGIPVDWWSIGIILYELLCDEVPFYSESLVGTYGKIMNHEDNFFFPDDVELSADAKDLISKLICKQEIRLGKGGIEEIMSHPWFKGNDWKNIRHQPAPFIPQLSGPEDTRYFEDENNESKKFLKKAINKTREFSGASLAFVGYNYVHNMTAHIQYPGFGTNEAQKGTQRVEEKSNASANDLSLEIAREKAKYGALQQVLEQRESQAKELEQKNLKQIQLLSEFQAQIDSLQNERQGFVVDISGLKSQLDQAEVAKREIKRETDEYVQNLRNESDARQKLEEQVSQVTSQLMDLKSELAQEKVKGNDLKNRIAELEGEAIKRQTDDYLRDLAKESETQMKLEEQVNHATSQLTELKSELAQEKVKAIDLKKRIAELEGEALKRETDEYIQNLKKESETRLKFEEQASQFASQLTDLKAELSQERVKAIELKNRISELEREASIQNHVLEKSKQQVVELQDEVEALHTTHKVMLIDLASFKDMLAQSEATKETLQKESEENLQNYRKEIGIRLKLEEQVSQTNARLSELTLEVVREKGKANDLRDRIVELESELDAQKHRSDHSNTPSMPVTREQSRSKENMLERQRSTTDKAHSNSRFRLSGMFFKSKENLVDPKHSNDIAEENSQVVKANDHRRMQSHQSHISVQSMDSLKGSLQALNKGPQLSVLDFFNPMDGLSGWVRVPKGGKVKKGWKKVYLVFSEDELRSFETMDEYQTQQGRGTLICNLRCEIFVARSVTQNELIHANADDIDLIFKIQASTLDPPANSDAETAEREARIAKLKQSIELEEKMLAGVNKILSVTTDAQKVTVIGQIDAANKRLRTFKMELETLEEGKNGKPAGNDQEKEVNTLRKELQAQLEDEIKKRDALASLAVAGKKKKHSEQAKSIEVEIMTSDRIIAKTKEQLELLNSNDKEKITDLVSKSRQASAATDCKGHVFCQRQYFKPTACGICSEMLYDSKNEGFECSCNHD